MENIAEPLPFLSAIRLATKPDKGSAKYGRSA